jgi:hypothetical protein
MLIVPVNVGLAIGAKLGTVANCALVTVLAASVPLPLEITARSAVRLIVACFASNCVWMFEETPSTNGATSPKSLFLVIGYPLFYFDFSHLTLL